jgi:hypothetical protein
MSGAEDGDNRDRGMIERELRVLAGIRSAYRERGKAMPPIEQMDELLDELIELEGRGKHRWENDNSVARPSLWR